MRVDGKYQPLPVPGATTGPPVPVRADKNGKAAVPFAVPKYINDHASLLIQQKEKKEGGKDVAKALKEIPIPVVIPSRLTVDFYPEGGELIEGIPTRVYYRVRTPSGEPATPDGHVIVLSGKEVLLDSRNEAVGVFPLTPEAGDDYTLRVTWPKHD